MRMEHDALLRGTIKSLESLHIKKWTLDQKKHLNNAISELKAILEIK